MNLNRISDDLLSVFRRDKAKSHKKIYRSDEKKEAEDTHTHTLVISNNSSVSSDWTRDLQREDSNEKR